MSWDRNIFIRFNRTKATFIDTQVLRMFEKKRVRESHFCAGSLGINIQEPIQKLYLYDLLYHLVVSMSYQRHDNFYWQIRQSLYVSTYFFSCVFRIPRSNEIFT